MNASLIRHAFAGRVLLIGFGCIGRALLPLLLRHVALRPDQVTIVNPNPRDAEMARQAGAHYVVQAVTRDNLHALLAPRLAAGDLLLNLSVDVSSLALLQWCRDAGVLYLDTCIEPWADGYLDPALSPSQRSNHALRDAALALRVAGPAPTAVLTHGANPGLVSHFVKQALLNIARDTGPAGAAAPAPVTREDWARLAQRLGVRVIHIAEHDTQVGARRKVLGEFVNTWSADAFVDEGTQPAELGWGSHERHFPADGAWHASGTPAAIYLDRPGAGTRVRSWTPLGGPMHGFLVTHAESISIAEYLTLGNGRTPAYRPTVHYAYHPCDDAVLSLHELAGRNWRMQPRRRLLMDDIQSGIDELGVLLMGHARGAYWYGSQLSIGQARALAPYNSATSLQVAAGVLAGAVWALKHPARGIVEPDEMPFDELLATTTPYLGPMAGVYTDWTPLADRGWLFDEDVDRDDPWQFKNFRVT